MTVALDATYSLGPALSGVGVYSRGLLRALLPAAPDLRFLLCYRANRFFRALGDASLPSNGSRRLLEEPWNLLLPRRARLFHGLNQRLPRYRFPRAVATFHDLFVMTAEYSAPDFRTRFTALARDAALRADAIIAVSRHTACQVEQLLHVDPSRIRVVHHGVNPVPLVQAEKPARPFLLHVGALQTRKNLLRLVEAFETLPEDLDLVLAGSDGYGAPAIHDRIATSPVRNRIRCLGYVDPHQLHTLYRTAAVLVFPSLDEGFGLPILEAMSAGLPVVTSHAGATAEVAGDAALLVDPADASAIAAGVRRTLDDSALRDRLIRDGLARSAEFTWDRAARDTLAVYRDLL
jgi:glycosyltransferase involved in cell wall biosynthesis